MLGGQGVKCRVHALLSVAQTGADFTSEYFKYGSLDSTPGLSNKKESVVCVHGSVCVCRGVHVWVGTHVLGS